MELELATTDDIIEELRRRKTRFVLAAIDNTNQKKQRLLRCGALCVDAGDLLYLLALARRELRRETDGD